MFSVRWELLGFTHTLWTIFIYPSTVNYISHFVHYIPAAAAKLLQLCPTLCDPIDGSSPGSPVPGILQARTLEWGAISFSSAWKWKVKVKSLSCVRLLATPWTAAYQAPLSMGFSRQEYWSGLPHYIPSTYLSFNWKYILFNHLQLIPPPPQLATCWPPSISGNHKSDVFVWMNLFWSVIDLQHYVSSWCIL